MLHLQHVGLRRWIEDRSTHKHSACRHHWMHPDIESYHTDDMSKYVSMIVFNHIETHWNIKAWLQPVGRIMNSWHANPDIKTMATVDRNGLTCDLRMHALRKVLSISTSYSAKYLFPAWLPPLMTLKEGTSEVGQKHSWTREGHQCFPAYSWGWLLTLSTISTSAWSIFFKNVPPTPKSSVQISASGWHHKLVCWLARKGGNIPQRRHVTHPNIETKSDQQDF